MQNLPKIVEEEINILSTIATSIKVMASEMPERAEEFTSLASIYDKMSELILSYDWTTTP